MKGLCLNLFLVTVFLPVLVMGEPVVLGVSGTAVNGSTLTISGIGFGSDVSVERISYVKPNLDVAGVEHHDEPAFVEPHTLAGWKNLTGASAALYDKSTKHSGSASYKYVWSEASSSSGFGYDSNTSIKSAFVTQWTKIDNRQSSGCFASQWKRLFIADKMYTGSDHCGYLGSTWYDKSTESYFNTSSAFLYTSSGSTNARDGVHNKLPQGQWFRMDDYAQKASAPMATDGFYSANFYDSASGYKLIYSSFGITHNALEESIYPWRYVNFGNYWGNNINLVNGYMSNLKGWTASSNAVLASVGGGVNDNCIQVTNNSDTYESVYQDMGVISGKANYWFSYKNSAGSVAGYRIYDLTHGADIIPWTDLPDSTVWDDISSSIQIPVGCSSVRFSLGAKNAGNVVWFDWANFSEVKNAELHIDDAYVSINNGNARVELVDTPVWADRKHAEIQYPEFWGDNQIKIKLNQGTLQSGTTVYLYVIDSAGIVSSSQSILLGGTSSGKFPPNPPNSLKVR